MEQTNEIIEKARPDELAKNWAIAIFIVIAIVAIGLFAINQFIEFRYSATFLRGPCQLCVELNPEVGGCWEMQKQVGYIPDNFTEELFKLINTTEK